MLKNKPLSPNGKLVGGTLMTRAIACKVVQAFKQPATFTTTFKPVKLEMFR